MAINRLLVVDDDPGMIQVMGRILSGLGQLSFATSGAAALKQVNERPPDLILLDTEMPGMSGYQVCEQLAAEPRLRDIPVIFVTAHKGAEFELRGLELGAVDFIAKPISEPLLLARVRTQLRIKRLTDELRHIATIDVLTDLANRRRFDEVLAVEWKRGLRNGDSLSLLMVDVDHFKLFNDRYGHPAGDACLRTVGQALAEACRRPGDLVARYGGEEFVVLLPQTSCPGAEQVARRVLEAVSSVRIPHQASPTADHVTVSIGISSHDEQSAVRTTPVLADVGGISTRTQSELLLCADHALYAAKAAGRACARTLRFGEPHAASASSK